MAGLLLAAAAYDAWRAARPRPRAMARDLGPAVAVEVALAPSVLNVHELLL